MAAAAPIAEACHRVVLPDVRARLHPIAAYLLLVSYAGLLFFPGLGDRDLNSSHEARAAQNAQVLLEEGDWLLPRLFDRHPELQKPPLYYWLVSLIARLRGGSVDAWAVRLPAASAALLCVLFLYELGRRRGRPLAGLLAALVLASCLHFTWMAHVGRIDLPLTAAVTVALGCFELGRTEGLVWQFAGYTALALGVLLKGPIAVVLALLVIGADVLAGGIIRERRSWSSLGWGVPWLLLLTVPWFWWANARTGGQLWEVFFWHHNFERGVGGSEALAVHPWWFYLPRAGLDLLPWSLFVPAASWWFVRRMPAGDRAARGGLLWFSVIFAFLSCMSFKRSDYLLPAYPGLAIFLGCVGEDMALRARSRRRLLGAALSLLLVSYGVGWWAHATWIVPREEAGWPYRAIGREVRLQTTGPVVFFRAESHLLAFHVGRPLETILEWENLAIWADMPYPVFFVMPEECARQWPEHLRADALEEVLRTADWVQGRRDRPLIVLRNKARAPAGP